MKTLLVPALAVFFLCCPSPAATTNLLPVADATLFELTANNNLGRASLAVGATATGPRARALLRFDVSVIPSNAIVETAELSFFVEKTPATGGEPSAFAVHRFLKPWNEGNGSGVTGLPADPGETTWNSQFHGAATWSQPGAATGAEYDSTASGSVSIGGIGSYAITGVTNDVQAWVSGLATNHGWIMISSGEAIPETARRITSREGAGLPPPTLAVQYTIPPSDPAPEFTSAAVTNAQFELRFTVPSTYCYEVQVRDSLTTASWSPLTNICATTGDISAVAADSLSTPQRFYRLFISGRVR